MAEDTYHPRILDEKLRRVLSGPLAVVIEGCKACGKTTTAEHFSQSAVHLDRDGELVSIGLANPGALLEGATPHLVDEWQLVPRLWNEVRHVVDERKAAGQFILTGSATPSDDSTRHSGAGRFDRLVMRPMSLLESGDSSGDVSLNNLWESAEFKPVTKRVSLADVAGWAVRGGWPGLVDVDIDIAQDANRAYLRSISSAEIIMLDGKRRDPQKVGAILNALGRNAATYVSNKTLQKDSENFGSLIDLNTVRSYLDALERLWVYAPQRAWGGHLRSATPARRAAKRHLVDPSLAAAAMGAGVAELLADHEAFGQVFESLVFRDLSVYGQAHDCEVQAFHDAKDNEIDQVLVRGNQWAGVEVKLSAVPHVIDAAAANLLAISRRMTTEPRFLAIITADSMSYRRDDGVFVLSVAHLRP